MERKMNRGEDSFESYQKPSTDRKRKSLKILAIGIIILFIVGTIGCIAYNAGFIPIKEFLRVREPIGSSSEVDIENYMEKYPEIKDIPNLDDIKYEAYGTNESTESVTKDYKEKLENDGYKVKYEGTVELDDGRNYSFIGFLKGLTAVGIVMTSEAKEEFGYETVVIYTTGNALDYQEILDWYQEN